MSFQIDKRTRVRKAKNIKEGEYFYITNEAERSNPERLPLEKLIVVSKCVNIIRGKFANGTRDKSVEGAEMKDVKMITGIEWSDSWEVEDHHLLKSYEFYRINPEDHPELFL